jgi:hypothetical protein
VSSAPQTFAGGRQDARVVLRRAARLRVGLPDLPAGVRLELVVFVVRPGESKPVFTTDLRADTRELKVPAGTWDLAIEFGRESDDLLRIDGVNAEAGLENHDPRLLRLDWQKYLSVVTVRVVGPDSRPAHECDVWQCFETRFGTRDVGVAMRDGIGRLLVPKRGSNVVVQSRNPAWYARDIGVVSSDVVVQLSPAPRIAVSISAMPELPEGAVLQAILVEKGGLSAQPPCASFDADGKCTLLARASGFFRLQLAVRYGNTSVTVDGDGQVPIEIGEHDVQHRFELTEALRRSIAEAAREP